MELKVVEFLRGDLLVVIDFFSLHYPYHVPRRVLEVMQRAQCSGVATTLKARPS